MPTPNEELNQVARDAQQAVADARDLADLDAAEVRYTGRKGELTGLLRLVGTLPAEEKPKFGQAVNAAKEELAAQIAEKRAAFALAERAERLRRDSVDVTLPGVSIPIGHQNILTAQMDAVREVLVGLGYRFVETPDIEHYRYNFETLNYPPDHPAFDEQMSFYLEDEFLLRTQTTAFQARVMEKEKPPLRVATIGRCFRYEAVDATHSHTFHQVDILAVDEGLTLADLKGTFAHFASALFGENAQVRFRPDYFPFVEPGVEIAVRWGDRWLELGGAGMVHPNILESMGIDSERYTGFAWGCGVERLAMPTRGIGDLRLFTENDLRFLRQF